MQRSIPQKSNNWYENYGLTNNITLLFNERPKCRNIPELREEYSDTGSTFGVALPIFYRFRTFGLRLSPQGLNMIGNPQKNRHKLLLVVRYFLATNSEIIQP